MRMISNETGAEAQSSGTGSACEESLFDKLNRFFEPEKVQKTYDLI